ncbi:MAG: MFS transporter [Proteobacteria bacterium]|nr:MFS transporter [Pseudomonadota bacterium]
MRSTLFSFWTLFFGITLFMVGNGLQAVLLGVRAENLNFGDVITGFVMGGYYIGYLLGSWLVPKLVSQVGHIRVFGAMAALASSSILVHIVFEIPMVWLAMRVLTGFAYVGMYIVAESWINDRATNDTRGKLLSIYMIVQMTGLLLGNYMLVFDDGESYALLLWVSIIVSFAAMPIMLTAASAPDFTEPERASLRWVYNVSPLAFIGMAAVGFQHAMVLAMGAVYAAKLGLTSTEISYFMVAIMGGAMLFQYPIGKLSDVMDRRTVIIIAHILSLAAAGLGVMAGLYGYGMLLLAAVFYGGFSFPLYALYLAHANDFLTPKQVVSTSGMLIMVNGAGAVLGSPVVGTAMGYFGAQAYFVVQGMIHASMIGFGIYRMQKREALPNEAQAPFSPVSGTQVAAALLPEAEWEEDDEEAKDTATDNSKTEAKQPAE